MPKLRSLSPFLAAAALLPSVVAASDSIALRVLDGARIATDKIVNGVLESAQPTVVSIRDSVGTLCSGTLIGCRTVLTAANCFCFDPVTGEDLTGAQCASRTDLLNPSKFTVFAQHGGFYPVQQVVVNSGYEFGVGKDLAIVRLAAPVNGIAPSPINRQGQINIGRSGTIVGFGRGGGSNLDYGLKRSGLVTTAACAASRAAANLCWAYSDPIGPAGQDSNTCDGDAGGPLFVSQGSLQVVAGVGSSGDNAECLAPDLSWNSDVFVERAWVDANGGSDIQALSCGGLPQLGQSGGLMLGAFGSLSGTTTQQRFNFTVPSGTAVVRLALNGDEESSDPNADYTLYAKAGTPPTTSDFTCRSNRAGVFEYCEVPSPAPGAWHVLVDRVQGAGAFQVSASLFTAVPTICTPSATTLCIDQVPGDRRFKVEISYSSPPRQLSGLGQAISLTSLGVNRGGLFYFFSADNPEVLVKVLNGCGSNSRYWVFATAGTDVGHTITVTDVSTGLAKSYGHTDGSPAEPFQDVEAFACP